MDILRFITAGSVDDGKSTLIGRLLYDSKSILIDQLAAIKKQSKNKQNGEIDLAILTDGLRAEREQGITIDVAYKYFSTAKRKFIVVDAPGHIQYTRNMVTGASHADVMVVLIDARNGVIEQTRRHSIIASLLGINHIVVSVNKMDLVDFLQERYNEIVNDYKKIQQQLNLKHVTFIPISALSGDNIVEPSKNMDWYKGESLLHLLENIQVDDAVNLTDVRFSVQYVIRPQTEELHDYRGYAGKLASGILKTGDEVLIMPSGISSTIKAIELGGKQIAETFAGQSITIRLNDDIDISRGDMLVTKNSLPKITNDLEVVLCWMDIKPLEVGSKYILQHQTKQVKCVVKEIKHKINVNTLEEETGFTSAQLNDVCSVVLKTASPLAIDSYKKLASNGAAILIDETSFVTVGACIISA
ncbi:MAG: GTP-binding protein [Bacteroidia bacterium]